MTFIIVIVTMHCNNIAMLINFNCTCKLNDNNIIFVFYEFEDVGEENHYLCLKRKSELSIKNIDHHQTY